MSKTSPHGWTLDTLEVHLSNKVAALDRFCQSSFTQSKERIDLALAAADKAVAKAEIATDKRFEGVNEFRAALVDSNALFMPRKEFQVQHDSLSAKVSLLTDVVTRMESRGVGSKESTTSIGSWIGIVLIIFNTLIAFVALAVTFVQHK